MRNFIKIINNIYFSLNFYSIFLIITCIPDFLNLNSVIFVNIYWVTKVALALFVIYYNFSRQSNKKIIITIFYWIVIVYVINIFIDVFLEYEIEFNNLYNIHGERDLLGFILGIIIAISFKNYNQIYNRNSFNVFYVTLFIGLFIAYFTSKENFSLDTSTIRFDANSTINSIVYGQLGCALCIVSIYALINFSVDYKRKILFVACFFLGLLSIMKASSRSPLAVIVIVNLFYLFSNKGFVKSLVLLLVFFIAIVVFINPFMDFFSEVLDSNLATRTARVFSERETSGRDEIYSNTYKLIQENFLLGSYYIIKSGPGIGSYPHNYILEVFMTNGIVVGILFLIVIFYSLMTSYKIIKMSHPATWVILLYLQTLVYGMFSSSLYSAQDFWALLLFTISLSIYNLKIINKEDKYQQEMRVSIVT
ncbi:hypothetical protein GCM10028806_01630 [Spirosoma terrae]|uniref:O-antigen ligase family protein n=1 Tax=Spirosoma terrae TaxID=1968276 RepID=A0A6L9LDB8_9BACT|nr:O-antigen ligase family protein [Spirosoma terrae]NDU97577.1 O-antigen ligase family protein [Spirosoma terrae]